MFIFQKIFFNEKLLNKMPNRLINFFLGMRARHFRKYLLKEKKNQNYIISLYFINVLMKLYNIFKLKPFNKF